MIKTQFICYVQRELNDNLGEEKAYVVRAWDYSATMGNAMLVVALLKKARRVDNNPIFD